MDHVELATPLYFTAAACRAALATERAQLAWLPAPAPDAQVADAADPLGGC